MTRVLECHIRGRKSARERGGWEEGGGNKRRMVRGRERMRERRVRNEKKDGGGRGEEGR